MKAIVGFMRLSGQLLFAMRLNDSDWRPGGDSQPIYRGWPGLQMEYVFLRLTEVSRQLTS